SSGGLDPSVQGTAVEDPVQTTQIAVTALKALGLNPDQLQGAKAEGTQQLPGLKLEADGGDNDSGQGGENDSGHGDESHEDSGPGGAKPGQGRGRGHLHDQALAAEAPVHADGVGRTAGWGTGHTAGSVSGTRHGMTTHQALHTSRVAIDAVFAGH